MQVKEEAILLLKCLARGAGSLLEPYVPAMLQHMLRQMHDDSAPQVLHGINSLCLLNYETKRSGCLGETYNCAIHRKAWFKHASQ